jgi:site-specific recombinase XerD
MTAPLDILSPDEVRALMDATSRRALTGRRNRALIAALYRGGLRLSEALALLPAVLDLEAGTIRVTGRSAVTSRSIGVDSVAIALFSEWAHARAARGLDGNTPFFCTLRGEPIKDAYIRALLPRLAASAGVSKRVHASGLRASHALELAAEGFPLKVLQEHLGIESLAATQRYLERYRAVDSVLALQSREWRSGTESLPTF